MTLNLLTNQRPHILRFCKLGIKYFSSSVQNPVLLLLGIILPTERNSGEASKGCGKTEHESKRFRELINRKLCNTPSLKKRQIQSCCLYYQALSISLSGLKHCLLFDLIYLFHPQVSAGRESSEYLNPSYPCLQMNRRFLHRNKQ